MQSSRGLKIIISGAVLIGAAFVVFWFIKQNEKTEPEPQVVEEIPAEPTLEIIGQSVEGRDIKAIKLGTGETDLLFVGGIHGGYEWNSVLLSYQIIDYYLANPNLIPADLSIHIIPVLNPDGLYDILGTSERFTLTDVPADLDYDGVGRFNANNVDLNRNFNCKWQPQSSWRGQTVSAGENAFSEPEAVVLRDYVSKISPKAAVFWHSRANTVYASECHEGVLPVTTDIMNFYADAASYNKVEVFDAYEVTGDAEGWLASIGIPAITVELETRESTEYARNLAGVKALLNYFTSY
jgi:hypothetical protein